MSNIDIYAVLEAQKQRWAEAEFADPEIAIDDCIAALRAAEQTGYLGTLYRTDFEVEGKGAFRSTCCATPTRGPRARTTPARSRTRSTARYATRSSCAAERTLKKKAIVTVAPEMDVEAGGRPPVPAGRKSLRVRALT